MGCSNANRKRPALIAWQKCADGIARSFSRIKSESCQKLILYGSVARGEDDEYSDIDLLILTWKNCNLSMLREVTNTITHENPCDVPLHIIFMPLGMEDMILKNGGKIICQ